MKIQDSELLAAVLDELIPPQPELSLAGGGRPAVVSYVQKQLSTAELAPIIDEGLNAISAQAHSGFDTPFKDLPQAERAALLQATEPEQPFFIPLLLLHSYLSYYQQSDVLEKLGYDARPPFPKGHNIDIGDADLLNNIRERIGHPALMIATTQEC